MSREEKIRELKNDIERSETWLSTEERLPYNLYQDIFSKLNHNRHDLLGIIFANENEINEDNFDVNPFNKVFDFLEMEGRIEMLTRLTEKRKEARYVNLKYTPDIVNVSKGDGDEIILEIIDVAVSRSPEKTFGVKFDKYNVYREFFEELDVSLTICIYDINSEEIKTRTWGNERQYGNLGMDEFTELVRRTEQVKMEVLIKIPQEFKEDFDRWLYSKFEDDINGKETKYNFDSNLTTDEFLEFARSSRNMKRFFSETESRFKSLFWETLYHSTIEEDEKEKIENLKDNLDRATTINKNEKNFKSGMKDRNMNYNFAAQDHKPKKGFPEEPRKETMEASMEKVKEKAKESYEEKMIPGLLFPIPFNFSNRPLQEKGPLLKKRRLEKLQRFVDEVKESNEKKGIRDSIIKTMSMILSQAKVPDDDYESFMKGDFVITDQGERIKGTDFQKYLKEENERKVREMQRSKLMEHHDILDEQMKRGRIRGIYMKKGEVICIRPSKINEVDEFKDLAGVGRKVSYEDRTETEVTKIKSLPFWDEEKSNRLEEELNEEIHKLSKVILKLSEKVNEARDSFKESSPENSSVNGGSSEEETEDMKKNKENFLNGMSFLLRYYERLFENLNFVSYMANSGFRIIQGITDNTFIITMPSESLFKGDTSVPYLVVSIQEKDDIHYNFGDRREKAYSTKFGAMYVTMGRRLDRNRLTGYVRMKHMVETGIMCLNHFRKESRLTELNPYEMSKLLLFVGNININTSSVLDNARYMAELCMSNFSFCHEYIEDKLMVPTKNILQVHLFKCLERLMYNLNSDMKGVRVRQAVVDDEGNVNMDSARITKGEFHSFFFSDKNRYQKMEGLLSEITVLFFSISKGLHGKYHNLAEIHLTPLKIEREIRSRNKKLCPMRELEIENREEFDPYFVCLAYKKAEESITLGKEQVRERFVNAEKINLSPLAGKTTSSTRSTLIEDRTHSFLQDDENLESFLENPNFAFLTPTELDDLISMFSKIESKARGMKFLEIKRMIRKEKEMFLSKINEEGKKERCKDVLENKIKFDKDSKRFSIRTVFGKDKFKSLASKIIEKQREDNNLEKKRTRFYTSGVVVTEVLKHGVVEDGIFKTTGSFAKECVQSKEDWVFGIRPKGQRTQKDREIFVLDLKAKFGLFPLEHFFKQMSIALPEEKISEPGDEKIRTLKSQVEIGFKWLSKMMGLQKRGEMDKELKPSILHFNLDMTKWAPRDNLFKFVFCISYCSYLKLEEKLYMIAALFKLSEKILYLDEELLVKTYWANKRKPETKDDEGCAFEFMTDGYTTNMIEVTLTWLQGQLNYLSSFLHAGILLIWADHLMKAYGRYLLIQINAHSDDMQTSIYSFKNKNDKDFVEDIWRKLDYYTRLGCTEISIKKSYISNIIKQFVSQYNIAGEQIYPWVKNMMSAISGCPYTVLKDDISSVISKVSEGLAKGAPKNVASVVIKLMKDHVMNVYGIRDQRGRNKFSELLGVKEEYLPMCLGGAEIFDYTTLAIDGPRSVDQMIIMELLKPFGASSTQEPGDRPISSMIMHESKLKALKLFIVLDQLSSDTPEEEDGDSFSSNINPLRSIRFKMRRTGTAFPFGEMSEEEKHKKASCIKATSPALGFMKPRKDLDLIKYYFLLFCNSNFRASLAGQSPNLLMMHKMVNKKRGLFRLKESTDVTLSKFEHDKSQKTNMTPEELCEILKKLMNLIEPTSECARFLWNKYIKSDPEFKVVWYVRENCRSSGAITKPNPFPIRKPNFSDYSEILNRIPVLLAYFFDFAFFKRNEIRVEFKKALVNDVMALLEIFPREMKYLFVKWREESEDIARGDKIIEEGSVRKYDSFDRFYKDLTEQERTKLKTRLGNLSSLSDTLEKRFRLDIERELKEMRQETGMEPTLSEVIMEAEFRGSDDYDISDRLLKMSRSFKMETRKILFCPPSISKEISDVTLAMRSQVESMGRITVNYTITQTQGQTARLLKLSKFGLKMPKLKELGVAISNLYSLSVRLGIKRNELTDLMSSCNMFNLGLSDLRENFKELPRYVQTRIICPLSLVYPEDAPDFLNKMDPMSILWLKAESNLETNFRVIVRYENVEMEINGDRRKIIDCSIKYSHRLDAVVVNKMMKTFISDLHTGTRNKTYKYRIHDTYTNRRNKLTGETPIIGYSTLRDMIVSGDSNDCTEVFKKMSILRVDEVRFVRRIQSVVVSEDLQNLDFQEMNVPQKIRHKDYRTQTLSMLKFKDMEVQGLSLQKLSETTAYRYLMVGDYTKVTIGDYLDISNYPGLVLSMVGGFSQLAFYEVFTGLNDNSAEALSDLLLYIEGQKEYKEGKILKKPNLSVSKEMEEKENKLKLKQSRWAEVMEKKRVLNLEYASSYISFLDYSSELFEESQFGGVPLDEMLIPQTDHDEMEVMIRESFKDLGLELMLEEATPDSIKENDLKLQSFLLYAFLLAKASDPKNFEKDIHHVLGRVKVRLNYKMKVIERACLNCANIALEGVLNQIVDITDMEFVSSIDKNYQSIRSSINAETNELYKIWKEYIDMRVKFKTSVVSTTSFFMGSSTIKKPKTRRVSALAKASRDHPHEALRARDSLLKNRTLFEKSKAYESGTQTEEPTDIETDKEIVDEVKALRTLHKDLKVGKISKLAIAREKILLSHIPLGEQELLEIPMDTVFEGSSDEEDDDFYF